MKNKEYPQTNTEEAQEICAKIKEEAARQVGDISGRAQQEVERILVSARQEAQDKKELMLKDLERQLTREREKILSSLNLEKKRIFLEEKNNFVLQVLQSVAKQAEDFRRSKDYPAFLKKAIIEGAAVIDTQTIDIFYSPLDQKIIDHDFIKEAGASATRKFNKNFVFKFQPADFSDIGVMLRSTDGRLNYDNRFQSRFKRLYDEVYRKLLQESF